MLKPAKILVIDSTPFNGRKQYPEIYEGFNAYKVTGFPTQAQCRGFMRDLDGLLTCETFYGTEFIRFGQRLRVKTFNQYNYEFFDSLANEMFPVPSVLLAPSYWKLDEMKEKYGDVQYLPPPTDSRMFADARKKNFETDAKRFLHIVGRQAVHDRNGTQDLIRSLQHTNAQFRLTIKSQEPLQIECADKRVVFDFTSPLDEADLYSGFDALIMPRRYGGLCLPMNEGLMSGLPVIMTNVSPNNAALPAKWLVEAMPAESFRTRTMIKTYSANPRALAKKIDWLCEADIGIEKAEAFELGYNNYSIESLRESYARALK